MLRNTQYDEREVTITRPNNAGVAYKHGRECSHLCEKITDSIISTKLTVFQLPNVFSLDGHDAVAICVTAPQRRPKRCTFAEQASGNQLRPLCIARTWLMTVKNLRSSARYVLYTMHYGWSWLLPTCCAQGQRMCQRWGGLSYIITSRRTIIGVLFVFFFSVLRVV